MLDIIRKIIQGINTMLKFILNIIFVYLFLFTTSYATENKNNQDIEEQINLNNEYARTILKNLNNDFYLNINDETETLNREINYLQSKIAINKKQKNDFAVLRDETEKEILTLNKKFNYTLSRLTNYIHEYKEKELFYEIIDKNIDFINNINIDKFTKVYEENKDNQNPIFLNFYNNYTQLYNLINKQLFSLNYLKNNISKYRKTNFFIDEFNIQNIIKKVDSQKYIKYVSNITNHYLNITVGEFLVVIFIILFFRLINTKIINILIKYVSKITSVLTNNHYDSSNPSNFVKDILNKPLILILYTFSIQISVLILVDNTLLISQITPWINTIYMAVFTWIVYKILDNSISTYAQTLLETYPNVRKEMIVFILRIIKIILILIVILFLFSQLGIDIKAIAASLGVGGIAIALASKDTLANFFGSLNIMTDNSFSQGDWIKTSSVEGTVVDIRMRTTRIRTFDNALITVPNSELANAHIMNWSKRIIGRRIKMSIGITYECKMEDIVNLKKDIYDMLKNHKDIATEDNTVFDDNKKFDVIKHEDLKGVKKTLLVYIDEYANSSINILIYCFSKSPDWEEWLKTKEDVIIKISELVHKNNCEFAYPAQTIHIKRDKEI